MRISLSAFDTLERWFAREQARGLVSLHVVPGADEDVSLDDLAHEVLALAEGRTPSEDVTEQAL